MKKKLLGFYDYTVVLTYAGMLFAFCGILEAIGQYYKGAILCLMMAGLCDMFDGAVASTKERNKQEKRFGVQIDSLSDLISFGILPAVLVYMETSNRRMAPIIPALYALAALIRLAYFNVLEEERQDSTTEKRESYLGVPVTTIALLLPAVYILYSSPIINNERCFEILICVTAIGFLAPVQIRKPKTAGKVLMMVVGILEAVAMILL